MKKLKIGDEAIVDLTQFTAGGKKSKELKRTRQFEKMGLQTHYYEPPVPDARAAGDQARFPTSGC